MSLKAIPILIVTTLSAAVLTPAQATDVPFRYQQHELATINSASSLYARVSARAARSCTSYGVRPLYVKLAEAECVSQLTDDLITQIDHPRLYDVHAAAKGAVSYAATR